jgi:TonB family protein
MFFRSLRSSPLQLLVFFLAVIDISGSQSAVPPDNSKARVVLLELDKLQYPVIARAARVEGELKLELAIRKDGSVASAVVLSGPALLMLRQAALDSAQRSRFECRGCGETPAPYIMKYLFKIVPTAPPKSCDEPEQQAPPPEFDPLTQRVTVFSMELWTCDPTSTIEKVRSAKCIYLWRCGIRESGDMNVQH